MCVTQEGTVIEMHATCIHCRIRQRAFFSFGMDVLLSLNLAETRQFFAAFFALSDHHWQVRYTTLRLLFWSLSVDDHGLADMFMLSHV